MSFAQVSGRKVHYEIHGETTDVPLVLIMGIGGSSQGWVPLQVPDLSARRRVVIYDHRGVAGSEDPGGPFTTDDLAGDLVGLLDALELPRVDLMGAFMGGMVAQSLALSHPDRVERMILVGTYARPDAKRRLLLDQWKAMAAADRSQELLMRNRLLWTVDEETLEDTELISSMIEFFARDGPAVAADVFTRQCDACLAHDTYDALERIEQPTLVLCGERDQLTPPKLHRELAARIARSRLVLIPGSGHLVEAEAAQRFNHTVLQFVEEDR